MPETNEDRSFLIEGIDIKFELKFDTHDCLEITHAFCFLHDNVVFVMAEVRDGASFHCVVQFTSEKEMV